MFRAVIHRLAPPLLAAASLLALAGCRPPPINCPPGSTAIKETQCPACETIENPPPGYCPCDKVWVCQAEPGRARPRREEVQARALAADPAQLEAQYRKEAAAERRERTAQENLSRIARALQNYCDTKAALGCPRGTWPRLEETNERTLDDLPAFRQVCTPFDAAVSPPPCAD